MMFLIREFAISTQTKPGSLLITETHSKSCSFCPGKLAACHCFIAFFVFISTTAVKPELTHMAFVLLQLKLMPCNMVLSVYFKDSSDLLI